MFKKVGGTKVQRALLTGGNEEPEKKECSGSRSRSSLWLKGRARPRMRTPKYSGPNPWTLWVLPYKARGALQVSLIKALKMGRGAGASGWPQEVTGSLEEGAGS